MDNRNKCTLEIHVTCVLVIMCFFVNRFLLQPNCWLVLSSFFLMREIYQYPSEESNGDKQNDISEDEKLAPLFCRFSQRIGKGRNGHSNKPIIHLVYSKN